MVVLSFPVLLSHLNRVFSSYFLSYDMTMLVFELFLLEMSVISGNGLKGLAWGYL